MTHIFISYRREDSAGEAGRIYDYIENKFGREAIFKDVDVIDPGDNFRDRINEAVGECQVLLAIIGRRWLQVQDADGHRRLDNPADWVRLEIEIALTRNVRVIPVLLDGVEMPGLQDLPESLQPLCYRNAARVRHDPDFRKDIERVIRVIEQHSTERQKVKQQEVQQSTQQLLNSSNSRFANLNSGNQQSLIAKYVPSVQINPDYTDGSCVKTFVIATIFFALELVITFNLSNSDYNAYETGHMTGQIIAHHIMAALTTGAISKFLLKKSQWLTTLATYIPVCAIFIGLGILGKSQ
ncbi:MAG: toll/interleukin-1 receptor domain-containing protein [Cyanobacteria bacterium P01_F01_bin.53]